MPVFVKQIWNDYKIYTYTNDKFRQLIKIITFGFVDISYFNSSHITFNIAIFRKRWSQNKRLSLEWVLYDRKEMDIYDSGQVNLKTSFYCEKINRSAIKLKRLSIPNNYKIKIKLADDNKTSEYLDACEFTLQDWDEFQAKRMIPVFLTTVVALVTGAIGWLLRGCL